MAQSSTAKGVIATDIGERLLGKAQRLGRIDRGCRRSLAVDQAVEKVEDVGLGGDARLKRQLDRAKHRLLIMLQHQRQDLGHLPITAGAPQELALQLLEGLGQLRERRAIAQCSGLALDHRQIVPPVIDRLPTGVVGPVDDPGMLAQELTLGGHDDPLGIDPDADRAVGERGG